MAGQPPSSLELPNLIAGREVAARSGGWADKHDPSNGCVVSRLARSGAADVEDAVAAATQALPSWSRTSAARRGQVVLALALRLRERREAMATIVAGETGKSRKDALAETDAAVEMGLFMAGLAKRENGIVASSTVPNRTAMAVRQPVGVAGLIVAANTPIANVAWKAFPSILCGNASVLKAAEDAPATALEFGRMALEAGVPAGVLNVLQGLGPEAGAKLAEHPAVKLVSFTGSTAVGRSIQRATADKVGKICLELGGKNPFVVLDDARLDQAVRFAVLSAFSNAGQRCAAGSRIIIQDGVYDRFREAFLEAVARLRVGPSDDDDLGPVINANQLRRMLEAIEVARRGGARMLTGGHRLGGVLADGYHLAPTVLEGVAEDAPLSQTELFGPVVCLYRARDAEDALRLANGTAFGLTAAVHTRRIDRAQRFVDGLEVGLVSVNGATYGNEPHMPFGGLKMSGNGWRDTGIEALDVYSEWKTVYHLHEPESSP